MLFLFQSVPTTVDNALLLPCMSLYDVCWFCWCLHCVYEASFMGGEQARAARQQLVQQPLQHSAKALPSQSEGVMQQHSVLQQGSSAYPPPEEPSSVHCTTWRKPTLRRTAPLYMLSQHAERHHTAQHQLQQRNSDRVLSAPQQSVQCALPVCAVLCVLAS